VTVKQFLYRTVTHMSDKKEIHARTSWARRGHVRCTPPVWWQM